MRNFPLAVGATAVGLDPEIYKQSGDQHFLRPYPRGTIAVENAAIRVRTDGQDPTATTGSLIPVGSFLELSNAEEVKGLRMIRAGGSDSLVQVTLGVGSI